MSIVVEWLEAKEAERKAVDRRREIEDLLTAQLIPAIEGTTTATVDGFEVKIIGRVNRKVDAEVLHELAKEHGLDTYVGSLFRWSAEVNATQWKNTHSDITNKLAPAITTTPGRHSYTIKEIE